MTKLLLTALLLLLLFPAGAQDSEDCRRPPTQELADYKEAYVPRSYSFESFNWEAADVAVLLVLLTAAGLLSLKHQPQCRFTALSVVALAYFGLLRGGCICPVGATTNFCIGLASPELIGKTTALLFLLPLAAAFFAGRIFCTSACPLGALQHLLGRKNGYQVSERLDRILRFLPAVLLAATVWGALRSGVFLACKLDVYKPVFFTGHAWIGRMAAAVRGTAVEPGWLLVGDVFAWLALGFMLLLGIFVPRPFCRYACPYGVLLGVFSKLGLRRRRIDPESCFSCVMCTRTCPVQAITADPLRRHVEVDDFHCIQCGRCDSACSRDALGSPDPFPNTPLPNLGRN